MQGNKRIVYKNCKQNSENLMKIGQKNKGVMKVQILQFFMKHFSKHQYEYAN